MLFQKVQQIYICQINMISFLYFYAGSTTKPNLNIVYHNLNIVLSVHPSFEPITALLQSLVCDHKITVK